MRNEFETELVRKVERRKKPSKAWAMVALCAAILVSAYAAITVVAAGNGTMSQDQLKDGTGDNCDGDGVCDNDCDGVCDNDADGDGVCDNKDE
ncbi:MAG: hypothetical protein JSV94_06525 [Methanobacteriota archaeon]|nr:MAG: hypothetical protein JSV94_06525 [Euryarchaeota archaeon]